MARPSRQNAAKPHSLTSGPELLVDLAAQLGEILLRHKIAPHAILPITDELIDKMTHHWGGQQFYFPFGIQIQRVRRNDKIWRRFNGSNQAKLSREFGISLQATYRIISNKCREEQAKSQMSFPLDELFTASDE